MTKRAENALFIKYLVGYLGEIEERLEDQWPSYRGQLLHLLEELENAQDDAEITKVVKDIVQLGLATPAAILFAQAQMQAIAGADLVQDDSGTGESYSRDPLKRPVNNLEIQVLHLRATLQGSEMVAANGGGNGADAAPGRRFLNAGFFPRDTDDLLAVDQPLALEGGPYRLGVNVGRFWGPGMPGQPFDEIVEELFADQDSLDLEVAVRSRSVKVEPLFQPLTVPKEGDSPIIFFDLTIARTGRHALDVDLFYQGHLLQSRHVEAVAVKRPADPAPAGAPAQDGWLTFSRAGTLTRDKLASLEEHPRRLTVTVQRSEGFIELCFYDRTQADPRIEMTKLTDANLTTLLNKARRELQTVTGAYKDVGGDLEQLRLNLWQLADAGSDFYRALLPTLFDPDAAGPGAEPLQLALEPGQVIQVAPLSAQAGVPWELLYERPIEPYRRDRQDRVALCPDFLSHEPDACPHQDNSRVVCPYGFCGYLYIIEQLPNRVPPKEPPPQTDLPLQVRNGLPLRLAALVYDFRDLETHLEGLRSLVVPDAGRLDLVRVDTLDGVEQVLMDKDQPADIVYFFAHGGFDKDDPILTLGGRNQKFSLTADDLAAWRQVDLTGRQPVVIFNACESAAYRPDRIESLLEGFAHKGAAGIIGTQVQVPTTLADVFIRRFFRSFLGPQSVGEALLGARKSLLFDPQEGPDGPEHRPDPRGLVYSLFAAAEVKLAQPILA